MSEERPDESAITAIEQSTRRQHFTDVRHVTVRWEPYKPDGRRQMKALGRWQEQVGWGDYWTWQNCNRPAFAYDPQDPASLVARIEALEAALANIRELNMTEPDANGHRWAVSELIEQECVFAHLEMAKEPTP